MSTNVTLSGGPRAGAVVAVPDPWPRTVIHVSDLAGGTAAYIVTDPNPASADAAYSAPTDILDSPFGDESTVGPQGPPGGPGPMGPPGETGPAGAGLVPAGTWDVLTTYEANEVVNHEGSSYVALALNGGQVPTDYPESWQLLAEKGDTGAEGPAGPEGDQGPQGDPGSPLPTRETTAIITAALASAAGENGTVDLAIGFRVLRIETDRPAWVRLYTTPAKRNADVTRLVTEDPTGDHGVVVEVVTTDAVLGLDLSPVPQGYSMEVVPSSLIAYRIVNLDDVTGVVTATLTWQQQEA